MNSTLTFDELKARSVALNEEQRGELASFLLASLHAENSQPDPAFRQLLAQRLDELRSGKVQGIPSQQAFASLDR